MVKMRVIDAKEANSFCRNACVSPRAGLSSARVSAFKRERVRKRARLCARERAQVVVIETSPQLSRLVRKKYLYSWNVRVPLLALSLAQCF